MWEIKSQYIQIQTSIFIYETNLWKILYVFKDRAILIYVLYLCLEHSVPIHFCMLTGLAVHT